MWTYATYDELYHHGIKGQKWGQRRFQYEDGTLTEEGRRRYGSDARKIGKRNFQAQMKRYGSSGFNKNSKVTKVGLKGQKELDESNEGKEYKEMINYLADMKKEAKRVTGSDDPLFELDKEFVKHINDTQDAYNKKAKEIANKYLDEMAGAMLEDLGYENTEASRKWLIKKKIIST